MSVIDGHWAMPDSYVRSVMSLIEKPLDNVRIHASAAS
jgi:hypothetical protein